MHFRDDDGATEAKEREKQRRERYAALAGELLGQAEECQFSQLPYDALLQTAAHWYDACAMAMLYSNFAGVERWVREQAAQAAQQGFLLNDLLLLLRLCRRIAIEKEGWNEDCLADFDAVVDEVLTSQRGKVPWEISPGLNYLTGKTAAELEAEHKVAQAAAAQAVPDVSDVPAADRRGRGRNKLHLPIRVRAKTQVGPVDETTYTEDVARNGLYFVTEQPLVSGDTVMVTYPYWEAPGALNKEYPAEVVRVEHGKRFGRGIALKFLVDLGRRDAFG